MHEVGVKNVGHVRVGERAAMMFGWRELASKMFGCSSWDRRFGSEVGWMEGLRLLAVELDRYGVGGGGVGSDGALCSRTCTDVDVNVGVGVLHHPLPSSFCSLLHLPSPSSYRAQNNVFV